MRGVFVVDLAVILLATLLSLAGGRIGAVLSVAPVVSALVLSFRDAHQRGDVRNGNRK